MASLWRASISRCFFSCSLHTHSSLTDKTVEYQDKGSVPGILPCQDILDSILKPKQCCSLVHEPSKVDCGGLDSQGWMVILGQRRDISRHGHANGGRDDRILQEAGPARRWRCWSLRVILVRIRFLYRLFVQTLQWLRGRDDGGWD